MTAYTGALFSDWTDRFSTEARVSYSEIDNRAISLFGTEFGEVWVRTFNDADGDGNFSQATEGEYRFDFGCNAANPNGCIDNFRNGSAGRITYENAAPSNIPEDAAASFDYQINTVYLQDEWMVGNGNVTLVAGLRYDWYESNDLPRENPNFIARNGFTNARNFDGEGLIQPRFGFDWDFSPVLRFHGGVGLYSGGNPNDPGRATSNYEIPHRFTFRVSYTAYWWGDNASKISLFASSNKGHPFSYTFANDDGNVFGDFANNRHLLCVPSGLDDPNVIFAPSFNTDAFFAFVNDAGLDAYSGRIAPRNEFYSDWWTTFDIRLVQEFPGFRSDHKLSAFLVIRNFCNLLNDEWCVLREMNFPRMVPIVDLGYNADTNQYVFEQFLEPAGQGRAATASLWEARIGMQYRF